MRQVLHDALIENTIGWLRESPDSLKTYQLCKCGERFNKRPIRKKAFDEVQEEYKLIASRYRADIALLKKGKLKGIIEIRNTSPISKKKIEFLKNNRIPFIEIDCASLLEHETELRVVRSHRPGQFVRSLCSVCDRIRRIPIGLRRPQYNLATQEFLTRLKP